MKGLAWTPNLKAWPNVDSRSALGVLNSGRTPQSEVVEAGHPERGGEAHESVLSEAGRQSVRAFGTD